MPHFCWVDGSNGSVPDDAIKGGRDKDGTDIYIGRTWHEGDLIPAKVIPSKGGAFVAYGGEEHFKSQYEVMCDGRATWVSECHGSVPEGAVPVGQTSDGERLYMGRVMYDGALTPGKVHPSHGTCYISYAGQEMSFTEYEILVMK